MNCLRCGRCCLVDFRVYVGDEDLKRWRTEGKNDILDSLENSKVVWAGDHFVSCQEGYCLHTCSFLRITEGLHACAIYETRPLVCQRFEPGKSDLCPQYKK